MNLDIFQQFLTGEPLTDAIIIGILFTIFMEFYKTMFNAMFSIFKK